MADDVTLPGTAKVIATDEVASRHYQLTKLVWGPDGTANWVDVASGKPLPVQLWLNDGTAIDLNALIAALGAYVDGLEALVGSTNTALATLAGYVDGLETLVGLTNTALSTLDGRVDGLETLIGSTNTKLDTVIVQKTAATGTQTIVAASATAGGVTVLALNTSRKGASIHNDSDEVCRLLLSGSGTISATVFSVLMDPGDYFEVPFGYTGIIKGLWDAADGSARVMEYT